MKRHAVANSEPMATALRRWSCDAGELNWVSNGEPPPPLVLWLSWVGLGRAVDETGWGLDGGSLVWLGKLSIEVANEDVSVGTVVSTSIPLELEDWTDEADGDVVVVVVVPPRVVV